MKPAAAGRYLVYKSFVGELAMHLQEVEKDSAASGEARLQVERMIEDKVCLAVFWGCISRTRYDCSALDDRGYGPIGSGS